MRAKLLISARISVLLYQQLGTFMKKVKITILKTMLNEDLAKEYGICGLKACPMMKVGWKRYERFYC